MHYPCPCCGHLVFAEPPGSYDICPICFWEDDPVQLKFPSIWGANKQSLIEAQRNFVVLGAVEQRLIQFVRPPSGDEPIEEGWRPVDPMSDNFEDVGVSKAVWPRDYTVLYYWRPTFWRRAPSG
jgi:hypothetical protein